MFKEVSNKVNFPKMEEKIQQFWEINNTFQKSMDNRKGNQEFAFYDGPPFATGLPHYGHLVPGTIKDVVPRFWTMKGKYLPRRFGWDCHGLPVEVIVEQELGFKSKKDIEEYGIANFNEKCRSVVLRYVDEWETIVKRTGRWVDFKKDYKTMDLSFMESVWWVFKQIWDKGYIKMGYKVNPYCTRCSTPLSKHESQEDYRDVQDPAISIVFKVKGEENLYLTAWTTTPWTLPSNLALAVKPEIDYVHIKLNSDGRVLIMAAARVGAYFKEGDYEIVKSLKGSDLIGLRYEPLFDYFKDAEPEYHQVIKADYVTTEDGTGIVHQAPAYGQEDFDACRPYKIKVANPIDDLGKFTETVKDYQGMYIKDADKQIIRDLKAQNKVIKHETFMHSYPHCPRCKTPLINKACDSWIMDVEEIKGALIENNKKINWIPDYIQHGRFGKLLETMPDWNISRNRWWGNPLPIWLCECGKMECIGSVAELKERTGLAEIKDIHKHFVDEMKIKCECGKEMTRTPEVLDCWFESGSMPYAQNHYPFENKEHFEANFPAEFISEGIDQTRGWFNKLHVLSTTLFDKPAFKNVIVNGMVLAEDGTKMSKSKKNFPPVTDVLDNYGADAMRMYLIDSPAVRGENLRFSEEGVKDVIKKVLLPLWNSYSFFVTYANIDDWKPSATYFAPEQLTNRLDKWIMSSLQTLVKDVDTQMTEYKLYKVLPHMVKFIDDMTNWYIRRSRRRFWKSENDGDKTQAYATLYEVLTTLIKVLAPVMPFVTEELYQNLVLTAFPNSTESVHLCDFPVPDERFINTELEEEMDFVMTVVKLGRLIRSEKNLKIRQPLASITVVANHPIMVKAVEEMADLIQDELNVKAVLMTANEEDLVQVSAKANFKILGKKFGQKVKEVAAAITLLKLEDLRKLEAGQAISVCGENIVLEDLIIQHNQKEGVLAASEGTITVSLDANITQELKNECHAREMINKTQNLRKESGFEIADRIKIEYFAEGELAAALELQKEYISSETLAVEMILSANAKTEGVEQDVNDFSCFLKLTKI